VIIGGVAGIVKGGIPLYHVEITLEAMRGRRRGTGCRYVLRGGLIFFAPGRLFCLPGSFFLTAWSCSKLLDIIFPFDYLYVFLFSYLK